MHLETPENIHLKKLDRNKLIQLKIPNTLYSHSKYITAFLEQTEEDRKIYHILLINTVERCEYLENFNRNFTKIKTQEIKQKYMNLHELNDLEEIKIDCMHNFLFKIRGDRIIELTHLKIIESENKNYFNI